MPTFLKLAAYPRIGSNFEMVITQMAFHPKLVDWCGVIHSYFGLFGVIPKNTPKVIIYNVCAKNGFVRIY